MAGLTKEELDVIMFTQIDGQKGSMDGEIMVR